MAAAVIDLRFDREPLHRRIAESITKLYTDPSAPTATRLALHVFWREEGLRIAIDTDRGAPEDDPSRYSHPSFAAYQFACCPAILPTTGQVRVVEVTGAAHDIDLAAQGDAAVERRLLPSLIGYLKDFSQWPRLRREGQLRAGVVMSVGGQATFFDA
ncbi:hypothetical protein [Botrimarina sp.]|uniref:hypothetical protein n=1 Tax=Botrimarina sp. TaxID=2795802 RepID=UPI0032EC57EB